MKVIAAVAVLLLATLTDARLLRARREAARQEPDTTCGKGFDSLNPGSKEYFATTQKALWTHPGRREQFGTFQPELKCWFAYMLTNKCGDLPSQADARKADLTAKCQSDTDDWLVLWKMFSGDEFKWFKKNFPAVKEEEAPEAYDKQVMQTMKELNKKELLCFFSSSLMTAVWTTSTSSLSE